ncbi:MAG: FAD-binding protein [Alphaproteobacteria bacterium]|nr:FAD-binding protein [Alphaproteobacteria bacterium]
MTDTFDVVVIGSGAGGGAAAWALAERGVSVLLLEAGPAYDPFSDYRLDRPDWETQHFPAKVPTKGRQTAAPMQKLEEKWRDLQSWNRVKGLYNTGERRGNWGYSHVVGLGGSTLHFTGEAHRMHPDAMRMRSRFGVAADWPMDYAELEPFYLEAERLVGVAGPSNDPTRPRSAPYPLPAHPLCYGSQQVEKGCQKLGLSFIANARAALSQPYDNRPACNYCGNCTRGCPRTDKGSVDVTFIPKAAATGHCTIRTEATVLRLEAGPADHVSGVEYINAAGAKHNVKARAIVVACGAVETPRLLLASDVGNESGQVGRHFMETLSWASSGLHDDPLGSHRGLPSDGVCWDFNAPDAIPGIVGGCRFSPVVHEADLTGPLTYATRVVGGWGRAHKTAMRERFGRALSVGAIGESLPNPGSYIDLDPEVRDKNGIAKARIHSHLDDTELKRLAFMAKTTREILKASGAGDIFEEYGAYDGFQPTHVFGTCRMGTDPAESVVDPFGRSHRWRNLIVADASVFPSSGGGESPALTIEALAIRSARHLADRAKRGDL